MKEFKLKNKINWFDVIFNKEFLIYLEFDLIKEISLASKLTRSKLQHIMFKCLQLSGSEFKFKFNNNIFLEYFNYLSNSELDISIPRSTKNSRKSLTVENSLNDIDSNLQTYRSFAKSFCFYEVERAGYYLFPILNIFDNLAILKLKFCTIPFAEFAKLGESLLNLKSIELLYVILAKLPTDNISPDNFIFPPNLNHLAIDCWESLTTKLLSNPYSFLFNKSNRVASSDIVLPQFSVPSLKKLEFFNNYERDNKLDVFLELNPQLESLVIQAFNLNYYKLSLIKRFNSLKNLEIDGTGFGHDIRILTLESINKLQFNNVELDYYEDIKKICLSCPNLTDLHFIMFLHENFQHSIDNFIVRILSNLSNLKTFNIILMGNITGALNFSKFHNIETLIVEAEHTVILNIKFSANNNIKKINFKSYSREINNLKFKKKFNVINNWKFKFYSHNIIGYKVNNNKS